MDESTMICETVWDEAPSRVVFKGHNEWGAYVSERTCENLYAPGSTLGEGGFRCSINYCPMCGEKLGGDA